MEFGKTKPAMGSDERGGLFPFLVTSVSGQQSLEPSPPREVMASLVPSDFALWDHVGHSHTGISNPCPVPVLREGNAAIAAG